MAEVVKVYRQEVGALRFIGKKYGDEDRVSGGFGKQWGDFFENGWFGVLEGLVGGHTSETCEDGGAYIGLMRWSEAGEPFQYWVGMFLPPDTNVPDGFGFVDFEPASLGVGWLCGPDNDIFGQEHKCVDRLLAENYVIIPGKDGAYWFFERYVSPRFTEPDEKGYKILDICHYVK